MPPQNLMERMLCNLLNHSINVGHLLPFLSIIIKAVMPILVPRSLSTFLFPESGMIVKLIFRNTAPIYTCTKNIRKTYFTVSLLVLSITFFFFLIIQ